MECFHGLIIECERDFSCGKPAAIFHLGMVDKGPTTMVMDTGVVHGTRVPTSIVLHELG